MQHVDLQQQYEDELDECGGNANMKSKDMVDITRRFQYSVRTLSRLPRRSPGVVEKLLGIADDTSMSRCVVRFEHTAEGLKRLTYQQLTTTVEENSSRSNFLSGIDKKEQQKQKEKHKLEQTLKASKAARDKEYRSLRSQRDKLNSEIEMINAEYKATTESVERSTAEQTTGNRQTHEANCGRLTAERDKLLGQKAELVSTNQGCALPALGAHCVLLWARRGGARVGRAHCSARGGCPTGERQYVLCTEPPYFLPRSTEVARGLTLLLLVCAVAAGTRMTRGIRSSTSSTMYHRLSLSMTRS